MTRYILWTKLSRMTMNPTICFIQCTTLKAVHLFTHAHIGEQNHKFWAQWMGVGIWEIQLPQKIDFLLWPILSFVPRRNRKCSYLYLWQDAGKICLQAHQVKIWRWPNSYGKSEGSMMRTISVEKLFASVNWRNRGWKNQRKVSVWKTSDVFFSFSWTKMTLLGLIWHENFLGCFGRQPSNWPV